MNYTPSQSIAIHEVDRNLQIIACAGSGKTQVIAARTVEILKSKKASGIRPENIVAFTFTDKAAAELKDRIATLVRRDLGDVPGMAEMYVGTIHGYCLHILQTYLFEYLEFSVLTDVQTRLLVSGSSRKSGLADVEIINGPSAGQKLKRSPQDVRVFLEALNVIREDNVDFNALPDGIRGALDKYQALLTHHRTASLRPGGKGRSKWHILPRATVPDAQRYDGSVADERRLFYVAITRSKKYLFCSFAPTAGNQLFRRPSVFMELMRSTDVLTREAPHPAEPKLTPRAKRETPNVVLSFSELKYFFECPYQFKLRFLYGFNPPLHEAIGYGKSLHDARAEVHKRALAGDLVSEADAEALVSTHLNAPFATPTLEEQLRIAAVKAVGRYLRDQGPTLRQTIHSEQQVEIQVAPGITERPHRPHQTARQERGGDRGFQVHGARPGRGRHAHPAPHVRNRLSAAHRPERRPLGGSESRSGREERARAGGRRSPDSD